MRLDICFTPGGFQAQAYQEYTAVVLDILRATSSITTAFANDCYAVVPVTSVTAAWEYKQQPPQALLAGERQGQCIDGFDLGNSPFEYTRSKVTGQTIVMTTTNGTRALAAAASCRNVYIGSFLNAAQLCRQLAEEQTDIVIVCAGTEGRFSLEDALCAGLIADRLSRFYALSDTALAAQAMYHGAQPNVNDCVKASSHARYLESIGFAADVEYCLRHDCLDVVPYFTQGMIRCHIK